MANEAQLRGLEKAREARWAKVRADSRAATDRRGVHRAPRHYTTQEERDQILALHNQGLTYVEIARKIGTASTTIGRVLKSGGLVGKRGRPHKIRPNGHAPEPMEQVITEKEIVQVADDQQRQLASHVTAKTLRSVRDELVKKRDGLNADIQLIYNTLALLGHAEVIEGATIQPPPPRVEATTIPEAIDWIADHNDGLVDTAKWAPVLMEQGGFGAYANAHALRSSMIWRMRTNSRFEQAGVPGTYRRKAAAPSHRITGKPLISDQRIPDGPLPSRDLAAYPLPSHLQHVRLRDFSGLTISEAAALFSTKYGEHGEFRLGDFARVLWQAGAFPELTDHTKVTAKVWWPLNRNVTSERFESPRTGVYRLKS